MTDKPSSDFERVCVAYWDGTAPPKPAWSEIAEEFKAQVRRGMLAALQAMREPSEAVSSELTIAATIGRDVWAAGLDELIRQGRADMGEGDSEA